jgi:hypothetical protein
MTMALEGRPVGSKPVPGESEERAINRWSVESGCDRQIGKTEISRCSLRSRGIVQDLRNVGGKGG